MKKIYFFIVILFVVGILYIGNSYVENEKYNDLSICYERLMDHSTIVDPGWRNVCGPITSHGDSAFQPPN